MSPFLTHLAGIALGETTRDAARLALPPRYAWQRPGHAGSEADRLDEAPVARTDPPSPPSEREMESGHHAPRAPIQPADAPAKRRHSAGSAAPAAPAPGETQERRQTSRRQDARAAQPDRLAARSPAPPLASPRPDVAGALALDPPTLLSPDGERGRAESNPSPAEPPHREAAGALRDRPFAPLSNAVLAGRTERGRPVEPVIHVTIDRIEVRAPAPVRPVAARRPPAEPSVSLSDFLRGDGPGTPQ